VALVPTVKVDAEEVATVGVDKAAKVPPLLARTALNKGVHTARGCTDKSEGVQKTLGFGDFLISRR